MAKENCSNVQESANNDLQGANVVQESVNAATVKQLVQAYNSAVETENAGVMQVIEPQLKEAMKLLNDDERAAQLVAWASSENPLISVLSGACGVYTLTALTKHKEMGTYELTDKTDIVDLFDLFKLAPQAFAKRDWIAYAEAANIAIRDYIANVMKITMSEKLAKFKLSIAAKALGITEKDMRTAKGTKGALQQVVDAICGSGFTVASEDAEALRLAYASWNNKSTTSVTLPMEVRFRKQLTRILVRIVNELEYSGE